jgi:hypothetical protein
MIAANRPVQRPLDAKLLVVDAEGRMKHAQRSRFVDFLQPGDLVIANDAATLPASLHGVHMRSGADIEVRLAARSSLAAGDIHTFSAVIFGAGDFRTRTEDRLPPPPLIPGDRLAFASAIKEVEPLMARVDALLGHWRLVRLVFEGSASTILGLRLGDRFSAHDDGARLVGRVDSYRRRGGCVAASASFASTGNRSVRCARASRSRRSRSRQASHRQATPRSAASSLDEPTASDATAAPSAGKG